MRVNSIDQFWTQAICGYRKGGLLLCCVHRILILEFIFSKSRYHSLIEGESRIDGTSVSLLFDRPKLSGPVGVNLRPPRARLGSIQAGGRGEGRMLMVAQLKKYILYMYVERERSTSLSGWALFFKFLLQICRQCLCLYFARGRPQAPQVIMMIMIRASDSRCQWWRSIGVLHVIPLRPGPHCFLSASTSVPLWEWWGDRSSWKWVCDMYVYSTSRSKSLSDDNMLPGWTGTPGIEIWSNPCTCTCIYTIYII